MMDITVTNILEGTRQYFQGLPNRNTTTNSPSPAASTAPTPATSSDQPSSLSYWPPAQSQTPAAGYRNDVPSQASSYWSPTSGTSSQQQQQQSRSPGVGPPVVKSFSHRNLPPIASLTDNINYRNSVALNNSVHKLTVQPAAPEPQVPSKPPVEPVTQSVSDVRTSVVSDEVVPAVADGRKSVESKEDKEVKELSQGMSNSPTAEHRPVPTAEHVFTVPQQVKPATARTPTPSPRAPTPFPTGVPSNQYYYPPSKGASPLSEPAPSSPGRKSNSPAARCSVSPRDNIPSPSPRTTTVYTTPTQAAPASPRFNVPSQQQPAPPHSHQTPVMSKIQVPVLPPQVNGPLSPSPTTVIANTQYKPLPPPQQQQQHPSASHLPANYHAPPAGYYPNDTGHHRMDENMMRRNNINKQPATEPPGQYYNPANRLPRPAEPNYNRLPPPHHQQHASIPLQFTDNRSQPSSGEHFMYNRPQQFSNTSSTSSSTTTTTATSVYNSNIHKQTSEFSYGQNRKLPSAAPMVPTASVRNNSHYPNTYSMNSVQEDREQPRTDRYPLPPNKQQLEHYNNDQRYQVPRPPEDGSRSRSSYLSVQQHALLQNQQQRGANNARESNNYNWNRATPGGHYPGNRSEHLAYQTPPQQQQQQQQLQRAVQRTPGPVPNNSYYNDNCDVSNNTEQHSTVTKQSTTSFSQRFPPVPQSNYDLNRQIFDRMNNSNMPARSPADKDPGHYPPAPSQHQQQQRYLQEQTHNKQRNDFNQAHYDMYKHVPQQQQQQQQGVPHSQSQQSHYPDHHRKLAPPAAPPQTSYQYQQSGEHHHQNNYDQPQNTDRRYQLPATIPTATVRGAEPADKNIKIPQHRPYPPTVPMYKQTEQRPIQQTSGYPTPVQYKQQQQPQPALRPPVAAPVPLNKPKRESPLDLSVKTVRQSADSTAKDDSDYHYQDMKNMNMRHPGLADARYPVPSSGVPKIDLTPNFATQPGNRPEVRSVLNFAPQSSQKEMTPLPSMESLKRRPQPEPHQYYQQQQQQQQQQLANMSKYNEPTSSYNDPSRRQEHKPQNPPVDQVYSESLKRSHNDLARNHSSVPKLPKVDPWKIAMDQQIEQRLNSARMAQQNNERLINGAESARHPVPLPGQHHQPPIPSPQVNNQWQKQTARPPLPSPRNDMYHRPPAGNMMSKSTTLYPQHSPHMMKNTEHIVAQISQGVIPDQNLLKDKNVINKLKSSLEEKEARLLMLKEEAKRIEKQKEIEEHTAAMMRKRSSQVYQERHKSNLPPFGALALERMCAPPSFPGYKLNVPRSNDTVIIDKESTHNYINNTNNSEVTELGDDPSDLDGLAAFLAARIRTKAELKQVGPSLIDSYRSSSLIDDGRLKSSVPLPNTCSVSGSPPKLTREGRLIPPPLPRRRLLSNTEEDVPPAVTAVPVVVEEPQHPTPPRHRDPALRSSSETSVFDFRESDSDSEMPVLERQTLMRRDRKTFGSRQNISVPTPEEQEGASVAEKVEVAPDASSTDPFWDDTFDKFVEQLEKRPPKRTSRKKKLSLQGMDQLKPPRPVAGSNEVISDIKKEETSCDGDNAVIKRCLTKPKQEDELQENNNLTKKRVEETTIRIKTEVTDDSLIETSKKPAKKPKTKPPQVKSEPKDKLDVKNTKEVKSVNPYDELLADMSDDDSEVVETETSEYVESTEDDTDVGNSSSVETSSSGGSSGSDDEGTVSKRLRLRTRQQGKSKEERSTKMKLRSTATVIPKNNNDKSTPKKKSKERSADKKTKSSYGDGSSFRPGWEQEVYKFKQQLRMPAKLINISKPPNRSSASLPDLDQQSLDSSDFSFTNKKNSVSDSKEIKSDYEESETETNSTKRSNDEVSSQDSEEAFKTKLYNRLRNGKKSQRSNSILNLLVRKYGREKSKNDVKRLTEDRRAPKVMPKATEKPELLPTPGLGVNKENVLQTNKQSKDTKKENVKENVPYVGYFRKKTVNHFKDVFKQKEGLYENDFDPVMFKTRTRNQTKVLKQEATIREVFGEERPASAPPVSCMIEENEEKDKKRTKIQPRKNCYGIVTRGKLRNTGRPGLRSAAVLRSNKAVQISKRHLNSGHKRSLHLLRALATKRFKEVNDLSMPISKKRLKLRSVRRKFRSGFDYIRKKKKLKKDGVESADGSVKEKKVSARCSYDNVEDIQAEIKSWVINKGLGETVLHRAARLGYTDVAAYCLEKTETGPSPRDNAGYTPLHEACSRGHLTIAKLLLQYGANVSESARGGIRPLHEAAENGFTELIRLLLSYGADPLVETYTGHTALSLVSDEEAQKLMQHHLADVQGNVAPSWNYHGPATCFDLEENGYNTLTNPPTPPASHSDIEIEISDVMLPPLYYLPGEADYWMLQRDVLSCGKFKTKDSLLKQLDNNSIREMKLIEFLEKAKCCNLLGHGERALTKAPKISLIRYDDNVRLLLGVERVSVQR